MKIHIRTPVYKLSIIENWIMYIEGLFKIIPVNEYKIKRIGTNNRYRT